MWKLRLVLSLLPFACGAVDLLAATERVVQRPNIVFVLADDLGYGDVKCFGGSRCQIETPNFDRMAAEGIRFTNAHANASVCVPTRVAIMTGRYPWRFASTPRSGRWGFLSPRYPPQQHTLGKMLKSAGYRTGYVGKWHLGTIMQTTDGKTQGPTNVDYRKPLTQGPPQAGFDDSFILPASLDMFPYAFVRNNEWVGNVTAQKGWSAFNRVGPAAEDFLDTKVLDIFCAEAERFITTAAQTKASNEAREPFFLFVALTSPHTPVSPSEAFQGKSKLGLYGDFVMETDHCLGRVLRSLERNGVANNTLVIATSDHGPANYAGRIAEATFNQLAELQADGHYSSGPFRGTKFSVYEGGLRVPFVARWPGTIAKQTSCDELVGLPDMMATFAEIAKVELTNEMAPDSFSLLPLLKDPGSGPVRDCMIMESTHSMTIRCGDYKLAMCPGSGSEGRFGNTPNATKAWREALQQYDQIPKRTEDLEAAPFVQLFNVQNDPHEDINLAAAEPERVQEMIGLLKQQIADGRTRSGQPIANDRQNINAIRPPAFVWKQPAKPNPDVQITETEDHIVATLRGKPVLRYNKSVQKAPTGISRDFDRSGYIHPIYTPSGVEVTGDFPADHAHQHALFNAWTNTTFQGRMVDFWNQAKKLGRVSHQKVIEVGNDYFTVELLHEDLTHPDGVKTVLKETWTVKIVRQKQDSFVFDITSKQTNVATTALTMNQYRYGGMGIRGNNQWFNDQVGAAFKKYTKDKTDDVPFPSLDSVRHRFTTSRGKRRFEGNHSRPIWVDLSGLIDEKMAGVSIMGHPTNFRYPQPVRLHPSKPYFCFAPMVVGEFKIEPGEVFQANYRYVVHDGDLDEQIIRSQWNDYQ